MSPEEIKHTRELATAALFVMRGFGMNPPAETSLPGRLLQLCNECERLDRACWSLSEERDALMLIARNAATLMRLLATSDPPVIVPLGADVAHNCLLSMLETGGFLK